MSRRLQTSLLLSMIVHLGLFALAGSWIRHTLVDGGRLPSAGSVMMVDWVDSPAPAPSPSSSASPEEFSPAPKEFSPGTAGPSSVKEAGASEVAPPKPGSPEGEPGGNAVSGTRLDIDFARMAWIRGVTARTLTYQRNAPKGFEGLVRSALSLHPSSAEGIAKISLRFDPSGTVSGVEIRSDSPELKTALGRVGWEAGPLPSRYQIPCSGVDVTITIAGERLSVGIRII